MKKITLLSLAVCASITSNTTMCMLIKFKDQTKKLMPSHKQYSCNNKHLITTLENHNAALTKEVKLLTKTNKLLLKELIKSKTISSQQKYIFKKALARLNHQHNKNRDMDTEEELFYSDKQHHSYYYDMHRHHDTE